MKICLIDGTHLCRRNYHVAEGLSDSEGNPTAGIFGTLKSLGQICAKFEPTVALVFWDSGVDPWRRNLYPEYKDRRDARPEKEEERKVHGQAVAWQTQQLHETVLPMIGIPSIRLPVREADDLIWVARNRVFPRNRNVCIIVSGDRDFLQMVAPDTWLYDAGYKRGQGETGLLVNLHTFSGLGKVRTPEEFLELRAMVGDKSDRIPNIPGLGEVTARKIILRFGTILGALSRPNELRTMGKIASKLLLQESIQTVVRNRWLIDLSRRPPQEDEEAAIRDALWPRLEQIDLAALDEYAMSLDALEFSASIPEWAIAIDAQLKRFQGSQAIAHAQATA